MTDTEALNLFTKARAALLRDEFFFGSLALRLQPVIDRTKPTAWTDGKTMGFNPDFLERLSFPELTAVICHEVLHCALAHHARRGNREPRRFNMAADYVVNGALAGRYKLPAGALYEYEFARLSVEAVYDRLPSEEGGGGGGGNDPNGNGQPGQGDSGSDPGGCGEVVDAPQAAGAESDWKVAVSDAAAMSKLAGQFPAGLKRLIEKVTKPRRGGWEVLRSLVDCFMPSDYGYNPPDRRHAWRGVYFPDLTGQTIRSLVVAVDTSGSIDDVLLSQFEGHVNALAADYAATVTVMYCDTKVYEPIREYAPTDLPIRLQPQGGGGTDFRPVFKAIDGLSEQPSVLIYLTDLQGRFPDHAPAYPVIWAATETGEAPFGNVLDISDK